MRQAMTRPIEVDKEEMLRPGMMQNSLRRGGGHLSRGNKSIGWDWEDIEATVVVLGGCNASESSYFLSLMMDSIENQWPCGFDEKPACSLPVAAREESPW